MLVIGTIAMVGSAGHIQQTEEQDLGKTKRFEF